MLRTLRPRDAPALVRLLDEEFPVESALYTKDVGQVERIVRGLFRWDRRLLLGLAAAVGHPIVRFLVIEEDGHVVGTTAVTFPAPRTGFIGAVAVSPAYRRRGLARQLMAEAHRTVRRSGRKFVALGVLDSNEPARALYRSLGYRPVRAMVHLVRPLTGLPAPEPVVGRTPTRRDFPRLAAMANAALPAPVLRVLPVSAGAFRAGPAVAELMGSTTTAWVLDGPDGLAGFVRATVSRATPAGQLSVPTLAGASVEVSRPRLIAQGLRWLHEHGASRAVVEIAQDEAAALLQLGEAGFATAFASTLMVAEVDAHP